MKKLYEEVFQKEIEVEKTETTKDDAGNDVKVTKKVKENTPVTLVIKNPSRKETEDAGLYYASMISNLINKGINTRHMLRKKIIDSGGFFTNDESKEFGNLIRDLGDLEQEYQKLILLKDEDKTEEDKKKLEEIQQKYSVAQKQLIQLEQSQQALFSNTAEVIADNKQLVYYTLFLTFLQENGELKPLFDGADVDEKYEAYDKLIEKDSDFLNNVIERAMTIVTLWRNGLASKQEDFDKVIKELSKKE